MAPAERRGPSPFYAVFPDSLFRFRLLQLTGIQADSAIGNDQVYRGRLAVVAAGRDCHMAVGGVAGNPCFIVILD